MKIYELARKSISPLLPPLITQVRKRILNECSRADKGTKLLDVGGRKSPYTIGVPMDVTIIDLPRESEVQKSLNLGINEAITNKLKRSRSNIAEVIAGDMTRSDLPGESFDMVVSVEVLEHVPEDELFVSEVSRVLRNGGVFIMTTPNGDHIPKPNPDHIRHYKRDQLAGLLAKHFESVSVEYAIAGGKYRRAGLKSWSARRPLITAWSAVSNVLNARESSRPGIENKAEGTHHLIAIARSPIRTS